MKSKHIVIFTQNLDIGGVQKLVVNLANFLAKFYKISIVLAEDNKPIKYRLNNKITILKIKTKKTDITKKSAGTQIFRYRVNRLTEILKTLKPDVVISHEDYNNFILCHLKIIDKRKKVFVVHNTLSRYENKRVHLLSNYFYKENSKVCYHNAHVIVVSKAIMNEVEGAALVYNGVENNFNLQNNYCNYGNYILHVGRLHPQKGQKDLIKAYKLISDKIDENLIIVGDGILKDELLELVQKVGLEERVKFVGFDNPYKYFKNAVLFAMPSYYEGFSIALLEAMKANLPIVAYDYKGSEEVLKYRVQLGNIEEFAYSILKVLRDERYRQKMLSQNKKIKEFSLHNTLKRYKLILDAWYCGR
ncbi:glycosyltransferase [Hippea jasoniae]|uniref:glycosyltransferase n=1 Tax=Hippea jasoniae TaxID=944479 RepID=UPI00055629B5|nr:glycosyltransferase [Hippea jasoniae]